MDYLLEILRRRWPPLVSILLFLLLTMPGPVPRLIVDEVRHAETAAGAGQVEAALGHIEALLMLQPQPDTLRLAGAHLALLLQQPERAREFLAGLPPDAATRPDALCLADRASLQLLEEPAQGWPGLLDRCPSAIKDLERLAAVLGEGAGIDTLQSVLGAVRSAGLTGATWDEAQAFLGAATDPYSSAGALRETIRADGPRASLALELLDTIEREVDPAEPAYVFAQVGQLFARSGEWQYAALAFQEAIAIDPDYIEARAYLGLALIQLGQDGLPELRRAVQAAPNAALPHVFLAQHFSSAGDLPQAIQEMEIANKIDPENPAIAAQLGSLYAAGGELDLAEAAYREAIRLAPEDARFWLLSAQFSLNYNVKLAELGLPSARNAVSLSGGDPAALDTLGYAHLLQGDLLLAERLLLGAVRAQPGRAQTQYHLGLLRIYQGDAQAGLAAFRAAEQLDPGSPTGDLARRSLENLSR